MEESILQYMQTSKSTPTFQFQKVSLLLFLILAIIGTSTETIYQTSP